MIVTSLPIWIIDMVGSVLMIVFSFLCLSLVGALRNRDNSNVIWTYLFWVCLGLRRPHCKTDPGLIRK